MNEWVLPSTTLLPVLPAVAAIFASPSVSRRSARRLGVGTAVSVLLLAILTTWAWYLSGEAPAADRFDPGQWLVGAPLLMIDDLNALLVPFAALIFLFVALAQPSTDAIESSLRQMLLAEAVTIAAILSADPLVLAALWCLSVLGGWYELRRQSNGNHGGVRIFCCYMLPSCVLILLGAGLMKIGVSSAAAAMIAVAVMIRKGIVPLHSWLPELFARAPLPMSVLFNAPQIGAWVAVRLVAPHAPLWVLEVISLASLLTAVHGAGMALVQMDPRRVLGWLFLSQSALILVGLGSQAAIAQAGGLAMWMSSGLALAGFGMTIAALEARRGPLSLREFAGGYERKPLLAVCFLVLGLASVGFPGTLGFVAQEALVHGVVNDFPYFGFAILIASMLNGITVLRTYFVLFCGRVDPSRVTQGLRRREQVAFVALVALLVTGGLFPGLVLRLHGASGCGEEPCGRTSLRRAANLHLDETPIRTAAARHQLLVPPLLPSSDRETRACQPFGICQGIHGP